MWTMNRNCPVCDEPVERLGPTIGPEMGRAPLGGRGMVVHTDETTYVVHAVCLDAFGDLLERFHGEGAEVASPAAGP